MPVDVRVDVPPGVLVGVRDGVLVGVLVGVRVGVRVGVLVGVTGDPADIPDVRLFEGGALRLCVSGTDGRRTAVRGLVPFCPAVRGFLPLGTDCPPCFGFCPAARFPAGSGIDSPRCPETLILTGEPAVCLRLAARSSFVASTTR